PTLHEARDDFFSRDRVLADAYAARVVNRIRERARHGADAGFAEALDPVEPPRLEAVDVDLRLPGHVHDRRQPVREIADAVVLRAWELAVPRNRIGRDLRTLDERPDHVGFGHERVDDDARVVDVRRAQEAPVARPRVHFHFGKTRPDAFVLTRPFAAGDAAA